MRVTLVSENEAVGFSICGIRFIKETHCSGLLSEAIQEKREVIKKVKN